MKRNSKGGVEKQNIFTAEDYDQIHFIFKMKHIHTVLYRYSEIVLFIIGFESVSGEHGVEFSHISLPLE